MPSFRATARSFGKVMLTAGALVSLAVAADNARKGHVDSVCFYLGLGCVLTAIALSKRHNLRFINQTLPAVYQEAPIESSRAGWAERIFGLLGPALLIVSIFLGYWLA